MIIKNNTGNILEIGFYDRFNVNMRQRLYLRPHGKCEILPKDGIILNPIELKAHMDNGSITIEGRTPVTVKVPETPETPEKEEQDVEGTPVITPDVKDTLVESPEEVEHAVVATEETTKEENDEASFVCEVCGKEFASSRGLNKHMKSHES